MRQRKTKKKPTSELREELRQIIKELASVGNLRVYLDDGSRADPQKPDSDERKPV